MNEGAGDDKTAELLEGFVEDVARIEIWGDEDVGLALEGAGRGFLVGDDRINGGVELEFAIDKPVWMVLLDLVDDVVDFGEVEVLAARSVSGVGEHGDSGLVVGVGLIGFCGVFNDGV